MDSQPILNTNETWPISATDYSVDHVWLHLPEAVIA